MAEWTPEKLASLRSQFGEASGGEMIDPEFRRIAELIFDEGGRRKAPYAGFPTLLDAPALTPALTNDDQAPAFGELQIALFGVPMDLGVTNRPGSRFGPRALRAIERIGPYNDALGCAPVHQLRVADIGDVPMTSRFDLGRCHQEIEAFAGRLVNAGIVPLAVGGDHSITHPILRAVGRERPVGLIHIDAHCDTGGAFEDEKFHHGGPIRNAVLDGVLDPTRTIQIGIRGSAHYIWEFSAASGMTVIAAKDIAQIGIAAIVERARQVVGSGPVYLSFDIDSLDPAFAPGTGTPEVGGLTTREVLALIRGVSGLDIIGGDVVEVAPQYDPSTNTAHNAAQMLFEILSAVAMGPKLSHMVASAT
jgi:agmatinase